MIKPLFDNILIEKLVQEKNEHGIIIHNTEKDATPKGKVLDLGEVVTDLIKIGDVVFLRNWDGVLVDKNWLVVKQESVVGIDKQSQ